jgi:hypothetical protein
MARAAFKESNPDSRKKLKINECIGLLPPIEIKSAVASEHKPALWD